MSKQTELSYLAVEPNSYLVAQVAEEALAEAFTQMGERNEIPGLLPMRRHFLNGRQQVRYDITGKRRLQDALSRERPSPVHTRQLITGLITRLEGLSEYLLRPNLCILDAQYVFVDGSWNPYLPLLPLRDDPASAAEELCRFFQTIVSQCTCIGQSDPYVDDLLKYLVRPGFRLEELRRLALPQAAPVSPPPAAQPVAAPQMPQPVFQPPVAQQVPPVQMPPVQMPPTGKEKKEKPAKKTRTPAPLPVPPPPAVSGGFAIPGGGAVPVPQPAAAKKAKSSWFGRKEKEGPGPVPPLQTAPPMRPMPAPQPAPIPAPVPQPAAPVGGWKGTVHLQQAEGTVLLGGSAPRQVPQLVCGARRIAVMSSPFTLGSLSCSHTFTNPKISRLHATILEENGVYYLRDENSTNHSYLNGAMIPPYTPCALATGAQIRLANEELTFVWEQP